MNRELKLNMAATILTAHVRHGYNISDPAIVGGALDAADALIAEYDKREADAAEAAKAKAKDKKPEQPPKP